MIKHPHYIDCDHARSAWVLGSHHAELPSVHSSCWWYCFGWIPAAAADQAMHRSTELSGVHIAVMRVSQAALLQAARGYASKDVRFGIECREAVLAGVNKLADAVQVTLGPKVRSHFGHRAGLHQHMIRQQATSSSWGFHQRQQLQPYQTPPAGRSVRALWACGTSTHPCVPLLVLQGCVPLQHKHTNTAATRPTCSAVPCDQHQQRPTHQSSCVAMHLHHSNTLRSHPLP